VQAVTVGDLVVRPVFDVDRLRRIEHQVSLIDDDGTAIATGAHTGAHQHGRQQRHRTADRGGRRAALPGTGRTAPAGNGNSALGAVRVTRGREGEDR
jgi:hypothetical protein